MFKIWSGGFFALKQHSNRPQRKVDTYELELCSHLNGKSFLNGENFEWAKSDILLFKPGDVRKTLGEFECYYVHFTCDNTEFCKKYIDSLPRRMCFADYSLFKHLIQSIVMYANSTESDEIYSLLSSSKLEQAILELNLLNKRFYHKDNIYSANIANACRFINENYSKNISMDEIASAAALSSSFTYFQFRKQLNTTPHNYLLQKRLSAACHALAFTDNTAASIAYECGFSTPNYFNKVFTQNYGVTPIEYRHKLRMK